MLITSLQPNLTRARATTLFKRPLLRLLLGRLGDVLDFYVPYRLFRVRLKIGQELKELCFAVDVTTGQLDHYRFDEPPRAEQLLELNTARLAPTRLDEQEAFRLLAERLARQAFLPGLFRIANLQTDSPPLSLYLPYWIGVYERGARAQIEVIDAVRGRFEGAKLRAVVAEWFYSAQGE